MRMCDAFAAHNIDVTVVFPYTYLKENLSLKNLHYNYDTKHPFAFRMQYVPLSEKTGPGLRSVILLISFFFSSLRIIISNIGNLNNTIIVSREILPVLPVLFLKKIFNRLIPIRVVPQLHEIKKEALKSWAYRQASGIMVNVPKAKADIVTSLKIGESKIHVMNAPMIDFSKTDCSKKEARIKINYHSNSPLVVYTGKISIHAKELIYILEAASILKEFTFMLTGGKEKNIQSLKKYCSKNNINNVLFTGFMNNLNEVRYYQLAADVLVSYYTSLDHPVEYNYPQKLQEYISTFNPVVTPDFEATRGVINNTNVFFVEPDNPAALADGIRLATENKALAKQKVERAFEASKTITYENKSVDFLIFLETIK